VLQAELDRLLSALADESVSLDGPERSTPCCCRAPRVIDSIALFLAPACGAPVVSTGGQYWTQAALTQVEVVLESAAKRLSVCPRPSTSAGWSFMPSTSTTARRGNASALASSPEPRRDLLGAVNATNKGIESRTRPRASVRQRRQRQTPPFALGVDDVLSHSARRPMSDLSKGVFRTGAAARSRRGEACGSRLGRCC
jgi:hypothetical protein